MSRSLLVFNPVSGNAKGGDFWLEQLRRQGIEAEPSETRADGTIPDLARTERLIVAGGDGTIRLHAAACVAEGCVLGVLPSGTGNDFARGLSMPLEPAEACRNLATGVVQEIDVGTVDDQIFLNVAHIGFATEVTREVPQGRKGWWGRFAYLRTLLERLRDLQGFKATIRDAHETHVGRWLQITVANGRSFGGGQEFFDASPFDGELDLLAIKPRPLHQLVYFWMLARLKRGAPQHPALIHLRSATFEISGRSRKTVTADGETLGRLPVRFAIKPGALRVIAPRSSTSAPGDAD
jgi:YegS/Rv2252/BmrU family lipid kinase